MLRSTTRCLKANGIMTKNGCQEMASPGEQLAFQKTFLTR